MGPGAPRRYDRGVYGLTDSTRLARDAFYVSVGFGVLGYAFRRSGVPVLPFVIAFILARPLEQNAREAFSATGGDPWFLFHSATSIALMLAAIASVLLLGRKQTQKEH